MLLANKYFTVFPNPSFLVVPGIERRALPALDMPSTAELWLQLCLNFYLKAEYY